MSLQNQFPVLEQAKTFLVLFAHLWTAFSLTKNGLLKSKQSKDFISAASDALFKESLGMPTEVFPYPTVKQVVFEIRYPNLFSIENKIGDFQEKIIGEFPESQAFFRRQLVFADIGPEGKLMNLPDQFGQESGRKMWVFKSKEQIVVNVTTSSLSISSNQHKTYSNPSSAKKFRDVIEFVLNSFFEVISVPIISRIGLRYIDECPLPSKDNETLRKFYNSSFPAERYPISEAEGIYFEITTKRNSHNLIYKERLAKEGDQYKLFLDFDGFENEVPSKDFLKVADELHEMIEEEYFNTIKEPVKDYMRTGKLE